MCPCTNLFLNSFFYRFRELNFFVCAQSSKIMNGLWVIIWLIGLIIIGWSLGFFCAGFYVCFLPFEVCIDPMKSINELLFKGVKIPYEIAIRMKDGKEGW